MSTVQASFFGKIVDDRLPHRETFKHAGRKWEIEIKRGTLGDLDHTPAIMYDAHTNSPYEGMSGPIPDPNGDIDIDLVIANVKAHIRRDPDRPQWMGGRKPPELRWK